MITRVDNAIVTRAYALAEHGASPGVIASVCGRPRRWAKALVTRVGATEQKRMYHINRERAFARTVARRAHAHLALRLHARAAVISDPAERLVRVYGAYRTIAKPPIFDIDEIHELTERMTAEEGITRRVCRQCRQRWYEVTPGSPLCPACESFDAHLCKRCGEPLREKGVNVATGSRPRRGRPRDYCDNCPPKGAKPPAYSGVASTAFLWRG